MKKISNLSFWALLLFVTLTSCDKNKPYEIAVAPPLAHFGGAENQTYAVVSANTAPYRILIGTTDVAKEDRTITFTVTSPTGAVAGTHYTLDNTTGSVTIPAGEAAAYINVQGIFDPYDDTGRKDSLIFRITEPSVEVASFQHTIRLLMRGPCFDGDVTDINVMAGDYTNTYEGGAGPYTTSITGITSTGATTAKAKLNNLWDYFAPADINLDWTDPFNTAIELPLQITDKFYAAGQPFYVRSKPGQENVFSVCNESVSFSLDVLVLIGGSLYYYDNGLPYVMNR